GCPFPFGIAENTVQITAWSDNGAGGTFGYLDANGQFVATSDPTQVTAYLCPGGSGGGGGGGAFAEPMPGRGRYCAAAAMVPPQITYVTLTATASDVP